MTHGSLFSGSKTVLSKYRLRLYEEIQARDLAERGGACVRRMTFFHYRITHFNAHFARLIKVELCGDFDKMFTFGTG
jgi:hypothetical protein